MWPESGPPLLLLQGRTYRWSAQLPSGLPFNDNHFLLPLAGAETHHNADGSKSGTVRSPPGPFSSLIPLLPVSVGTH